MLRQSLPVQHTGLRGYLASRCFRVGWSTVAVVTTALLMLVVPMVMSRLRDQGPEALSNGVDRL